MKTFISYRDVEPDRNLATAIGDCLKSHGLVVAMQTEIPLGARWSEYIDRELNEAGYFIVLVSEASAKSDMVQEEIRVAYELLKRTRLRILPIKIGQPADSSFPYELRSILRPLQHVEWSAAEPSDRVCQRVLEVVLGAEGLFALINDSTNSYSRVRQAFTTLLSLTDWTDRARERFAAYWDQRALAAAMDSDRDRSLLAWLHAATLYPSKHRLAEAADLIGEDWPLLEATLRNLSRTATANPFHLSFWTNLPIRAIPGGAPGILAISPDGSRIVAAQPFSTEARIFDTETQNAVGEPLRHERPILSAAFSPDGLTVATGGWDDAVRFWRSDTGEACGSPISHAGAALALAFSPDGNTLLTCGRNQTFRWSAKTGELLADPLKHSGVVNTLAFSPDGTLFLTGDVTGVVRLWRASDDSPGPSLRHAGYGVKAVFSADGRYIVTAGPDRTARFWYSDTGQSLPTVLQHPDSVSAVAWHPTLPIVATGSAAGVTQLWRADDGEPVGPALRHADSVTNLAFDNAGARLVTNSKEAVVRVWRIKTGPASRPAILLELPVTAATWSPGGDLLFASKDDRAVRRWNPHDESVTGAFTHDLPVTWLSSGLDNDTIYTISRDQVLRRWQAGAGFDVGHAPDGEDTVVVAASPSEDRFVIGRGPLAVIYETSGAPGLTLTHDAALTAAAFSSDGKLIVTACRGRIHRWSASTGIAAGDPLKNKQNASLVAATQDGAIIVVADGKTLFAWKPEAEDAASVPVKCSEKILAIAVNPSATGVFAVSRRWLYFFRFNGNQLEPAAARLLNGLLLDTPTIRCVGGNAIQLPLRVPSGIVIATVVAETPAAEPISGNSAGVFTDWQARLSLRFNEDSGEFRNKG